MANITLRNLPDSAFQKAKLLSEIDRRSLNSELILAVENGLRELERRNSEGGLRISPETQAALWGELAGAWKDRKSKARQIREIYEARTQGRDVSL